MKMEEVDRQKSGVDGESPDVKKAYSDDINSLLGSSHKDEEKLE